MYPFPGVCSAPITSGLPSSSNSAGSPAAMTAKASMPAAMPVIVAGTALMKRRETSMTSTVTPPMTNPRQSHCCGRISTSSQAVPAGAPANLGSWLPTMISPTPLR